MSGEQEDQGREPKRLTPEPSSKIEDCRWSRLGQPGNGEQDVLTERSCHLETESLRALSV